jgi:hypothetical protein
MVVLSSQAETGNIQGNGICISLPPAALTVEVGLSLLHFGKDVSIHHASLFMTAESWLQAVLMYSSA